MKRVMPFVQATREKVEQLGVKALALTLEFDEAEVLKSNSAYLANTLDVSIVFFKFHSHVVSVTYKFVISISLVIFRIN